MVDRLIEKGHHVIVLDDESTGSRENVNPAAEYIRGDITVADNLDLAFHNDLDAVFHFAARVSMIQAFHKPLEDSHVNVIGTIGVVQKVIEHNVPRLIYASSMTAYGNPDTLPTPESHPCRPISYYGISKYAGERYVHVTAERNDLVSPIAVTSFRIFNTYGERQSLTNPYQGVVAIFIGNLSRNEPITIHSDGEQTLDFVHVADVVEAFTLALDNSKAYGEVFNIGSGESKKVNEVADVAMAAMGRSRADYRVNYAPGRPGDQRHMRSDIRKARDILGWQPQFSFDEGIRRTAGWALKLDPFR